jgi:hypothetical protein
MLFLGVIMKISGIVTGKFVMQLGIACAIVLASAKEANANRISLPPSINLAVGDQHELGQASLAVPEGDADITQYVNFMIGLSLGGSGQVVIGPHTIQVTRSMNDFGPLPGPATLALRGKGTSINLGTQGTYDYLFAHYGGPGGGTGEVWYVGDLSGIISIPAIGFGHGLSGWALFTTPGGAVPDGGTTAILLGTALGALGIVRRVLMV